MLDVVGMETPAPTAPDETAPSRVSHWRSPAVPRVVLLTEYPADHATFVGGVQTATAALIEGLQAHRSEFEFHVVSASLGLRADVREQRNGIAFHFLSIPRAPRLPTRAPFRIAKTLRELRRIRPALVHCQTVSTASLAAVLGGYRRALTIHGVGRDEAHLRTGRVRGAATAEVLLERYLHDHFPSFFCISNYAASVVGERGATFAIPNPVASTFLRGRRPLLAAGGPRLVFLGVMAPLKRPLDLLLAHAQLRRHIPNLETDFCGQVEDVAYAESLRRLVAERGIEGVRFLAHAGREQTAELLRRATVLVLPSAQENAPMVIAEAMAVGLPVVATRVGGVPEMVGDGETGFLHEPGDVAALTALLQRLLEDPGLCARLGAAGRRQALARYAPSAVAHATVAAYRTLLR